MDQVTPEVRAARVSVSLAELRATPESNRERAREAQVFARTVGAVFAEVEHLPGEAREHALASAHASSDRQ